MTDRTISPPGSPLRRRMTEDMTIRGFTVGTQRGYLVAVENFTSFLGRAPDGATAEDRGATSCTCDRAGPRPPP